MYRPSDPVEWIIKSESDWTDQDKHNGYSIADAAAIQGLVNGTATPEQQKRAINWIITVGCKTHDFHYFDSQRDTDLALGKSFVGKQIVKLSKMDTSVMEQTLKQHKDNSNARAHNRKS